MPQGRARHLNRYRPAFSFGCGNRVLIEQACGQSLSINFDRNAVLGNDDALYVSRNDLNLICNGSGIADYGQLLCAGEDR
jgi:hypothetical protein